MFHMKGWTFSFLPQCSSCCILFVPCLEEMIKSMGQMMVFQLFALTVHKSMVVAYYLFAYIMKDSIINECL